MNGPEGRGISDGTATYQGPMLASEEPCRFGQSLTNSDAAFLVIGVIRNNNQQLAVWLLSRSRFQIRPRTLSLQLRSPVDHHCDRSLSSVDWFGEEETLVIVCRAILTYYKVALDARLKEHVRDARLDCRAGLCVHCF